MLGCFDFGYQQMKNVELIKFWVSADEKCLAVKFLRQLDNLWYQSSAV